MTLKQPILVTGGAGFIGSHLVESLIHRGDRVIVLDDLSSGRRENLDAALASGMVEFIRGSVCDLPILRDLLRRSSQVYHLAASVGVGMITAHPVECLQNNVIGVQNLLSALAAPDAARRVVLFSSSEVYGKSDAIPLREDGDLVLGASQIARWSYASGKVVGEFLALGEYRRRGTPVTVVRCFNTCGPRQRSSYGMVMPRFCDSALKGEALTVFGDGRQTRCFSYVEDVVEQVVRLAGEPAAIGEVYNIGSDCETSVLQLAERVRELSGGSSDVVKIPYREIYGDGFEDVRRRVPDLSKLRRLLGDLPTTDLDTMVRATLRSRLETRDKAAAAMPAAVSASPGSTASPR